MPKTTFFAITGFIALVVAWFLFTDFGSSTTPLEMNNQTIKQHTDVNANAVDDEAVAEATLNSVLDNATENNGGLLLRSTIDQLPRQIKITNLQGELIDAHITAIEHSPELEKHFFETGTAGDAMWGNWAIFDYYSESKIINLSENWATPGLERMILLVEAEGYLSETKFVKLNDIDSKTISIELFDASPVTVKISATDGSPIADVFVSRYGVRGATVSGNGTFEDQVKAKTLANNGLTDSNGEIVFKSVEQLNHLVVEGNGEYSSAQKYAVVPGQTVEFTLTQTFTVSGHVYDMAGNPLADIGVGAYLGFGAPDRNIQSVATDASGYYEMHSLTATASNVEVLTYAADKVSQVYALSFPEMGESYEVDFRVPDGVGGKYTFITSWGEPMSWVGVGFLKKEHDWVAYQYETKEDGTIDCQKAFDPNLTYFLNLMFEGLQVRPRIELKPGGDQEIIIDQLARIAEIKWSNAPQDIQPLAYMFVSRNSNANYAARWLQKDEMPLLPAGAGTLEVIWPKKVKQSFNVVLEERGDNLLQLDYTSAKLHFELPKGVNASIKLTSSSGFTVFSQKGASDSVEVNLMPGVYNLAVKAGEVITTFPDIQISEADLNLGEIVLANTATVYGILLNEDGTPWRGVDVLVTTMYGSPLGSVTTDDDGSFVITELPAGNARLMVVPGLSLGRAGSTIIQNLNLVEGDNVGPIELQMASGDYLIVKFSPWGLPRPRGFCLDNGIVSYNEVSSEGYFQVSSPRHNTWVGAGAATSGKAWWYAAQVLAGETEAELQRNGETKRYTFLDAQQKSLGGMVVKFELSGTFLPGTATTDANGEIIVEHSPGLNLELIAMLPGGFSQRWSVLQTPSGTLTTVSAEDNFVWNISSSDGKPLAGVICSQQGYGGYGAMPLARCRCRPRWR